MAKARVITARLRFTPHKHGADMNEAGLAKYLSSQLEFASGLDVETVADRDPMPAMLAALRRVDRVCEDAVCDARAAGDLANEAAAQEAWDMVTAAIAMAEGREG